MSSIGKITGTVCRLTHNDGIKRLSLSYLFKSIGMKSSMITFSTDNKQVLKGVADRFNSKDYLIVSYQMDTQKHGSIETYQVTMIIKSKRNNDEGHLLSLIQEFPEVTVERIE